MSAEEERGKAPPPPSPRQEAILTWVRGRRRVHATVNAVAGSGKTTTLKQVCAALLEQYGEEARGSILFCAFNKHIAKELSQKLPDGVEVATLHSIGFSLIRAQKRWVKVENKKYDEILRDLVQRMGEIPPKNLPDSLRRLMGAKPPADDEKGSQEWGQRVYKIQRATVALCDLSRAFLVPAKDRDQMYHLIDTHSLCDEVSVYDEDVEAVIDLTAKAREIGWEQFQAKGIIDYTDMIFLPAAMPGKFPVRERWFVLADEIQDFSPMMTRLLRRLVGNTGRFLGVGDPSQAIYGFAGADPESFAKTTSAFKAEVFPLDVCYRCPVSHILEAQEYVPAIQPRDNAPEGELSWKGYEEVLAEAQPGDMVICRVNAPLVSMTYALLTKGTRARMMGRDIGAGLAATLRDIRKGVSRGRGKKRGPSPDSASFPDALASWEKLQREKLERKKNKSEVKILALEDKVTCLSLLWEHYPEQDLDGFEEYITNFYSDVDSQPSASVTLSSIHRAKGLEADRVIWLDPDKSCKVSHAWEMEQEKNLRYIALTRAKRVLWKTSSPKRESTVFSDVVDPECSTGDTPEQS